MKFASDEVEAQLAGDDARDFEQVVDQLALRISIAKDRFHGLTTIFRLYFVVQQFEGYVLTPLVQQYAVDLPGVVLLFSLLAFGTLFGTLGLILAAPLTVVSYVLVKRLYVIEALHTATPIPGEKNAD